MGPAVLLGPSTLQSSKSFPSRQTVCSPGVPKHIPNTSAVVLFSTFNVHPLFFTYLALMGLSLLLCLIIINRVVLLCRTPLHISFVSLCGSGWILEYLGFRLSVFLYRDFINLNQKEN